jgi:hypothetical protein
MGGTSTFREQECKLNAPTQDAIEQVWRSILSDPHYHAVETDESSRPAWLSGLRLQMPHEVTPLRMRVYCDKLNLRATREGVDIRLQYSANGKSELMVKIPTKEAKAASGGAMDRMEYSSKLKQGPGGPDLTTLEKACTQRLKGVFEDSSLKDVTLYPLLQILTQRSKMHYHPDGDPDTEIELSMDIGRGQTCLGQEWPVFQIELEMVKGDPARLKAEAERLMRKFAFLSPETRSKPAPGFELLGPYLADKDIRDMLARELAASSFRNLAWHDALHEKKPEKKFAKSAVPV